MIKKNKYMNRRMFTLVELMVSMFIFLLMMGAMARYFAAANQIWRTTARKNEIYSNARIAIDLMSRDLQCAMYNNDWDNNKGIYPFWHTASGAPTASLGEAINFIASSPIKPPDVSNVSPISSICEIRYSVIREDNSLGTYPEFWLVRATVGDNDSTNYDFDVSTNSMKTALTSGDTARMTNVFGDCTNWQKVIPYVVDLKFECISIDTTTQKEVVVDPETASSIAGSPFPSRIKISVSLINKATYLKYSKIKGSMSATEKQNFLDENKLTFSRTVYMRKRESY